MEKIKGNFREYIVVILCVQQGIPSVKEETIMRRKNEKQK